VGLISITLVIAARFIDITDCLHNLKRSTDDQTLYILFKRNIKWMCKQTIVLPCKFIWQDSRSVQVLYSFTNIRLSKFIIRFIYYDDFIELKLELKQKISNWLKTHLHPTEFNLKIFQKVKHAQTVGEQTVRWHI
jgi:hypothetical protein